MCILLPTQQSFLIAMRAIYCCYWLFIVCCNVLQSFYIILRIMFVNLKNNVRKFLILYFISDRKLILALIVALGIEYVASYEMI